MDKTNRSMKFLKRELLEYEKNIEMNDAERQALHEWVAAGNSVHENGSMACYEGGRLMDFLDVYRQETEILEELATLKGKEREKYIRELRGEKNIDDLRDENDHYWFLLGVYEYVLRKHGLLEEAEHEVQEAQKRSKAFCKACRLANDGVEMPFE